MALSLPLPAFPGLIEKWLYSGFYPSLQGRSESTLKPPWLQGSKIASMAGGKPGGSSFPVLGVGVFRASSTSIFKIEIKVDGHPLTKMQ